MYKKILCCLLVAALVLVSGGVQIVLPVTALPLADWGTEGTETTTTMPDFTDDIVLVVMTHEASMEFIDYTPADFPEIECAEICDLSTGKGEKVQAILRGELLEMNDINARIMNQNIDIDSFHRILSLKLENSGKGNVLRAIMALEQREDVLSAEPNYIYQVQYPDELQDTAAQNTQNDGWAAEKIQLEDAWEIETGSSSVRVGILDGGIDAGHSELSGKVSTTLSKDFVANDSYTALQDPTGHGTHIAGIIAAKHNNDALHVSGVCQYVTLVSLSIIEKKEQIIGYGTEVNYYDLVAAINYAETKNIPILNLSFTLDRNVDEPDGENFSLHAAINNFTGLLVSAAANNNIILPNGSYPIPGGWNYNHIILIGASTPNDTKCDFSNYHSINVDLFAPGESILSTYSRSICSANTCGEAHRSNGYHYMSGTSMAAPFVAAVAALVWARHPDATRETVKATIVNTVDEIAALDDYCLSGGRLNAYNALMSKILHNDVTYTSINAAYHLVSCNDCDLQWQEPHLERPGVEVCIYCQEPLY